MARQAKILKTTFTSGELDPSLAAREDIKHYYNGADKLRNVIVRPQGGCDRRWGLRYIDELWPQLSRRTGMTITAPNGGTTANANDDDVDTVVTTTNNISTTNPYVVLHYDLGSDIEIYAATMRNFELVNITAATSTEFFVQYSTDNTNWTNFGPYIENVGVNTGAFQAGIAGYRRSGTGRTSATARYWRLARVGATDLTTARVAIGDFNLHSPTANLSNVKMVPIDYNADTKYMLFIGHLNVAVYKNEEWQTDIRFSVANSLVPDVTTAHALDTVLTMRSGTPTSKLFREGSDTAWGFYQLSFDRVPVYQFPDTPQPGAITIDPSAVSGNGITLAASSAYFTSDMVDWVVTLPTYKGSGGGSAVITAFGTSTSVTADVLEDFASVATAVPNAEVREPAFSSARGYPSCGCFHEGRLFLANTPQAPNVLWASRVRRYFDFDDSQSLDDYGFVYELTGSNVPTIFNMVSGRHLQVLGSNGEYYALPNDAPLTPNSVTIKRTTDSGSKAIGINAVGVEGATVFIQRGGKAIREFVFVDTEQAYQAQNISLLSSHLINDPSNIFVRRGTSTQEGDLVGVINDDGTMAVLSTLRTQDVTAWSLLITDGDFIAADAVDDKIYCVVDRVINGVTRRFIEVADSRMLTDCGVYGELDSDTFTATASQTDFVWTFTDPASASLVGVTQNGLKLEYATDYTVNLGTNTVTLTSGAAAGDEIKLYSTLTTITGLDHLEGETVKVIIDGALQTDKTVSGGSVTLDSAAYESYDVGLKFPDVRTDDAGNATGFGDEIWVRDMPIAPNLPDGSVMGDKKRIFEVTASILTTGEVYIGANGEAPELAPLRQLDVDLLNVVNDFTGNVRLEGILGSDEFGRIEFTQRQPAKFTLLGALKKVAV
jgi:hypothetical protein